MPVVAAMSAPVLRRALRAISHIACASAAQVQNGAVLGKNAQVGALFECGAITGHFSVPNVASALEFLDGTRRQIRVEEEANNFHLLGRGRRLELGSPARRVSLVPMSCTLSLRMLRRDVIAATARAARRGLLCLLEFADGALWITDATRAMCVRIEHVEAPHPVVVRAVSATDLRRMATIARADWLGLRVHGVWNGSGVVTVSEDAAMRLGGERVPVISTALLRGGSYQEVRWLTTVRPRQAAAQPVAPSQDVHTCRWTHELDHSVRVETTALSIPIRCDGCSTSRRLAVDVRALWQMRPLDIRTISPEYQLRWHRALEEPLRRRAHEALLGWLEQLTKVEAALTAQDVFLTLIREVADLNPTFAARSSLDQESLLGVLAAQGAPHEMDPDGGSARGALTAAITKWVRTSQLYLELPQIAAGILRDLAQWEPVHFGKLLGVELYPPSVPVPEPSLEPWDDFEPEQFEPSEADCERAEQVALEGLR